MKSGPLAPVLFLKRPIQIRARRFTSFCATRLWSTRRATASFGPASGGAGPLEGRRELDEFGSDFEPSRRLATLAKPSVFGAGAACGERPSLEQVRALTVCLLEFSVPGVDHREHRSPFGLELRDALLDLLDQLVRVIAHLTARRAAGISHA